MASGLQEHEREDKSAPRLLTVACVLKEGGEYNLSHVRRLEKMVVEHVDQAFGFYCLDDSPFPGWWAKISLFEPGRFTGRVLYLDLDVTVVGGLDDLADYPAPFTIIKDWNLPGYNSSVMAWDAGVGEHIFSKFVSTPQLIMHTFPGGDQQWIRQNILGATFPTKWCVSYKRHVRPTGKVPSGARVVVYHGKPKPWYD